MFSAPYQHKKSIDRIQIISWLATVMFTLLLLLDYRRYREGLFEENSIYRTLFKLHVSGLLYLIPACLTTFAKETVIATRLSRAFVIWLTVALLTFNVLGQAHFSYQLYTTLTLYMIYVLVSNWTFTMNHNQRISFNVCCFLILLVGIQAWEALEDTRKFVSIYEGIFFTIIAFLFGTFDYNLRGLKYLEEQELEVEAAA